LREGGGNQQADAKCNDHRSRAETQPMERKPVSGGMGRASHQGVVLFGNYGAFYRVSRPSG
jgi:hypothetical protein